MTSIPNELIGSAGRRYLFEKLIYYRPHAGRVWVASSGQEKFVLKNIPKEILSGFNESIWPRLRGVQYVRLPWDTIPGQRIHVYKYLTGDFLSLVGKRIPRLARKQILKAALRGLAALHDRDVVHLDIKPDNIMANCRHLGPETVIQQVQIIDLENAAYLPRGRCIKGMLAGNDNWRSPEAHFKGELNKASDMFSFGAVCIYAVLGRVVFGPDDDFSKHQAQGALPALVRLQRQVSFFGDQEGLDGLMKHVGDEDVSCRILQTLWEERAEEYIPYVPFAEWPEVDDAAFRELVLGMMNLDPTKRITARQALDRPWFADPDIS
ncbi:MAG: hypothetical protein M1831_000550 [Alyxoria varia]|nr:MAG: hypothetical protein M1831_000550 [Alyxoria varia]